jgi:hypothetical protein
MTDKADILRELGLLLHGESAQRLQHLQAANVLWGMSAGAIANGGRKRRRGDSVGGSGIASLQSHV